MGRVLVTVVGRVKEKEEERRDEKRRIKTRTLLFQRFYIDSHTLTELTLKMHVKSPIRKKT